MNHSSYHRGQVTTLLRQAGHRPPDTDFIIWVRLKGQKTTH
ncbi:MAG: DinB family protein [Vicinamibacterales bacterium]